MDRCEARRLLEQTSSFEIRDGGVLVRDLRLLSAVASLRRESGEEAAWLRDDAIEAILTAA